MKLDIKSLDGQVTGSLDLSPSVFGIASIRRDLLARVVQWQLAKRRGGNHKTKGISDISGTTAKPWKQKGTGQARQGSKRSPQWKGGATIFGPVVRSHELGLQKKVRQAGLRHALSAKAADGKLVVLEGATAETHKTKMMVGKLKNFASSLLIIDGANLDVNFARSIRNLPHINLLPEGGANVHDILRHDTLALTRTAVEQLTARLQTSPRRADTRAQNKSSATAA